ncbi:unnamed protein product [Toxocara canis]|uniref:Transposase n=1 Tax=Toxocara canis TaxID=6265 RepID=A0A183UZM1_TOXCA|nr:unnamed protein product [Toxocara canis]
MKLANTKVELPQVIHVDKAIIEVKKRGIRTLAKKLQTDVYGKSRMFLYVKHCSRVNRARAGVNQ